MLPARIPVSESVTSPADSVLELRRKRERERERERQKNVVYTLYYTHSNAARRLNCLPAPLHARVSSLRNFANSTFYLFVLAVPFFCAPLVGPNEPSQNTSFSSRFFSFFFFFFFNTNPQRVGYTLQLCKKLRVNILLSLLGIQYSSSTWGGKWNFLPSDRLISKSNYYIMIAPNYTFTDMLPIILCCNTAMYSTESMQTVPFLKNR